MRKKYSNKILFIEGTPNDKNGSLRLGFENLFQQKLQDKMPRIRMGEDSRETIRKFKHSVAQGVAHALVDLDGKGVSVTQANYSLLKASKRKELKLQVDDQVYFMVQEMEAWFLSQPEILNQYFKTKIGKIPFDHPSKIEDPVEVLAALTKHLNRPYHKVKDGSQLLEMLELDKLEVNFDDVRALIKKLKGT